MPSQHSARLGKAGAKFGTVETESNTVTRPFQRGSQRPVSVLTTSAASQTVSDQARFLRFSNQLAASVKPQVRSDIAWAEEFFHPATAHGYTNAGSPKHDLGSRSIGHSLACEPHPAEPMDALRQDFPLPATSFTQAIPSNKANYTT